MVSTEGPSAAISTTPKPPTDEIGAAIHAIIVILGVAGLFNRLNLTPDQVAVILSGLMTIAGIIRAAWLRLHPPVVPVAPDPKIIYLPAPAPALAPAPAPQGEGGDA